jgi:hypothetical protein
VGGVGLREGEEHMVDSRICCLEQLYDMKRRIKDCMGTFDRLACNINRSVEVKGWRRSQNREWAKIR